MRSWTYGLAAVLFLGGVAIAQEAAPPPAAEAPPAAPGNPAPTGPIVQFSTSMGDFTVQIDDVRAPISAANFLRYVRAKHYDGTAVYRVEKGFVIQMGSFDAKGNYRQNRPPIALEANNRLSNLRGTLALARGNGPKEGAQAEFFINVKDNQGLDQAPDDKANQTGYAVFGQVIAGMDVVDAISNVPVGGIGPMPGSAPVTPIVIKKATVLPVPK